MSVLRKISSLHNCQSVKRALALFFPLTALALAPALAHGGDAKIQRCASDKDCTVSGQACNVEKWTCESTIPALEPLPIGPPKTVPKPKPKPKTKGDEATLTPATPSDLGINRLDITNDEAGADPLTPVPLVPDANTSPVAPTTGTDTKPVPQVDNSDMLPLVPLAATPAPESVQSEVAKASSDLPASQFNAGAYRLTVSSLNYHNGSQIRSTSGAYLVGLSVPVLHRGSSGLSVTAVGVRTQFGTSFPADPARTLKTDGTLTSYGGGAGFAWSIGSVRFASGCSLLYSPLEQNYNLTRGSVSGNPFTFKDRITSLSYMGEFGVVVPSIFLKPELTIAVTDVSYAPSSTALRFKLPFSLVGEEPTLLELGIRTWQLLVKDNFNPYESATARFFDGYLTASLPVLGLGNGDFIVSLLAAGDITGNSTLFGGGGIGIKLFGIVDLNTTYVQGGRSVLFTSNTSVGFIPGQP